MADEDVIGLAEAVHLSTRRTLELLQAWLDSEALAQARLVLATDRAVAVVKVRLQTSRRRRWWG